MKTEVYNVLTKLSEVLRQLSTEQYKRPCTNLDGATVGQHSRHIIELFEALLAGYETGVINYDNRKRDEAIETEVTIAVERIRYIREKLDKPDQVLQLVQRAGEEVLSVTTNYYRELLYNVEHCIHHQALIKVALKDMQEITIHEHFGVAYATIAYRKQCAQ